MFLVSATKYKGYKKTSSPRSDWGVSLSLLSNRTSAVFFFWWFSCYFLLVMQMWAYAAAAVTERRMRAKDKEVVCRDTTKSKEN